MVTVYSGNECKRPVEIARSVPNDVLKRNIELLAPQKGFDIEVEVGSFSIGGGIFSPSSTGVIIYHKKYKRKYHSFIVEIKEAYGQVFLYTHFGGKSSNAMNSQMDQTRYGVYGGDVYQHTPGVLGRAMAAKGRAGLQDEELYYDQLFTLVAEAIRYAYDNPNSYSAPKQEPPKQSAPKASAPKSAPSAQKASAPKTASSVSKDSGPSSIFSRAAASKTGTQNSAPTAASHKPLPVTRNRNGSVDIDARLHFRGQVSGTLFKNEAALQKYHPQIYSALMSNPIYRSAPKTNKADLDAVAAPIEKYAQSFGLGNCLAGKNFPKSFCHFGTHDIFVMYWGASAYRGSFDGNGYVITGDWFCQFTNFQENFRISLSEIRSVSLQGGRIYVNDQPLLFDNDLTQQYHLLVYTIGTLLSMKYPGNTATAVDTVHTGSLSAQQSGTQTVDGTYRFVNPKLKKKP